MKLGDKVRDAVTGLEGILTSKVEYINGCTQCCVQPPATDGKVPEGQYIDYQRLSVIDGAGVNLPSKDAGGSMRDTPSANYRG